MKKFILFAAVAAAIGTGAFLGFRSVDTVEELDPTQLANLHALTDYESAYPCPDACMDWDGNSGGGIACDCGRYVGKCKRRCA